jgi:hypothetical protein
MLKGRRVDHGFLLQVRLWFFYNNGVMWVPYQFMAQQAFHLDGENQEDMFWIGSRDPYVTNWRLADLVSRHCPRQLNRL